MSMGMTSARHAREVVSERRDRARARGARRRAGARSARAARRPARPRSAVHDAIRARVPFFEADREFGPDIADAVELVRAGRLVACRGGRRSVRSS